MITNEESYRVRTPDGKEIHVRRESIELAVESARDLLAAPNATLEVTDRLGKVRFFSAGYAVGNGSDEWPEATQ